MSESSFTGPPSRAGSAGISVKPKGAPAGELRPSDRKPERRKNKGSNAFNDNESGELKPRLLYRSLAVQEITPEGAGVYSVRGAVLQSTNFLFSNP